MSDVASVMPGRRPVLRDRAFGNVDVDVGRPVEVLGDVELVRLRAHVAHRRLRRLLHDVAELAGDRQPPLAGHPRRLDEHDLAADLRPGQAGGHADLVCASAIAARTSAGRDTR